MIVIESYFSKDNPNRMSSEYRKTFQDLRILSDSDFSRMKDAEFISSLIIILTDGIITETPNILDDIYSKYDEEIPNIDDIEERFKQIISVVLAAYFYFARSEGKFQNKNYFYSLFAAVAVQMYGVPGVEATRNRSFSFEEIGNNHAVLFEKIVQFMYVMNRQIEKNDENDPFVTFVKHHKVRTTSKAERQERVTFLADFIGKANTEIVELITKCPE